MCETCLMLTQEGFLSDYYRTEVTCLGLTVRSCIIIFLKIVIKDLLFQKYLQILLLNGSMCEFLLPQVSMTETLLTFDTWIKRG